MTQKISRLRTRRDIISTFCFRAIAVLTLIMTAIAIVGAVFPEYNLEYIIFTLPLWIGIYVWGAPSLLMSEAGEKQTIGMRLKALINPMCIAMVVGMLIGFFGLELPDWIANTLTAAKGCMSPIAMLLTGIMVASAPIGKILKQKSVYLATFLRLLAIPAVLIAILAFIPFDASYQTLLICAVASVAMPLGMNTIIIPAAYGKDTTEAVGLTMVSHILSVATIPLVFYFMNLFLLG